MLSRFFSVILVLLIFFLSGCLSEGVHDYPDELAHLNPSTGYISGNVLDAYGGYPISGIKVTVYDEWGKESKSVRTDSAGSYKIPVLTGIDYFLEFSRYAYIMEMYYGVDVEKGITTNLDDVRLVPQKYSGECTLKGSILDEDESTGIEGARISVRRGAGESSEPSLVEAFGWSGNDGSFEFSGLASRNYTLEIKHVGYTTLYTTAPCLSGISTETVRVVLKQDKVKDKVKVSLNWGDRVKDLDSHVTGPQYSSRFAPERFHVYYKNLRFWEKDFEASLDQDVKQSFGTETIEIDPVKDGDYIYYVHNYKNFDLPYPVAMKNSQALVTLYYNDKKREFTPPAQDGNLWAVFMITQGKVKVLGKITDESSPDYVRRNDKEYVTIIPGE